MTRHLDGRVYFSQRKYASRPDCIYRWNDYYFGWKDDAKYHSPGDLEHDLGASPQYVRANVLLSERVENFRYFKGECPIEYKALYPHLKSLIERLAQGHRVNFDPELQEELRQFMERLWNEPSAYQETAVPEAPCRDRCSGGDDDFVQIDC
jgi:hypothetical protein